MKIIQRVLCFGFLGMVSIVAQAQGAGAAPGDVPTFHATSSLVFLDVTVVDKGGTPVVKGLTKEDFTIIEDGKPQQIFSFEGPAEHVLAKDAEANPQGKAPNAILVLDELNCRFEQMAYLRYMAARYLSAQGRLLGSPTELMVLGNNSLELVQGYTRDREELEEALEKLPGAIPYKLQSSQFQTERFAQTLEALEQLAVQNRGQPGRKNIIWLGVGAPGFNPGLLESDSREKVAQFLHRTTNMLVNSRMSLFVIHPGQETTGPVFAVGMDPLSAESDLGDGDPFASDVSFGRLVNETGGRIVFNRNDVDMQMGHVIDLGSRYYTLTYQPPDGREDGRFRSVRVTLRNPKLKALTKAGYYSPDGKVFTDPSQELYVNLATAAIASIPYSGLTVTVQKVVRHSGSRSVAFTALVKGGELKWEPMGDGRFQTKVVFAAASVSGSQGLLASILKRGQYTAETDSPQKWGNRKLAIPMRVSLPRGTDHVRVMVEVDPDARVGTADIGKAELKAAPEEAEMPAGK